MYANESRGAKLPGPQGWRLGGNVNLMGLASESLFPEYYTDAAIGVCPSDPRAPESGFMSWHPNWSPDGINVQFPDDIGAAVSEVGGNPDAANACRNSLLSHPISYMYVPFGVRSGTEILAVSVTMSARASDATSTTYSQPALTDAGCPSTWGYTEKYNWGDGDITPAEFNATWIPIYTDGGNLIPESFYRLREGIERFFITDINNPAGGTMAQSELVIMQDAWGTPMFWAAGEPTATTRFNHTPGGSNVLYLDGHVSFVRYGEEPMPSVDAASVGDDPPSLTGHVAFNMGNLAGTG